MRPGWIIFLAFLLTQVSCSGINEDVGGNPKLTFRLALELNQSTKLWEAAHLLKQELEKASPTDGIEANEINVQFYDQGSIGTERQLLEACYFGVLEMVQVNSSVVTTVEPQFSLLDLPYLFIDDKHLKEVLNGEIGYELLDKLNDHNMQGLAFYTGGFRNVFYKSSSDCADDVADLGGLKIRVMESPLMVDAINSLGMSATPIPFSELYQSLKTGVVDGAENSANIFASYRYDETGCNCFVLTEHFTNQHVIIANQSWLDSIDPKYKKRILAVSKDIVPRFDRIWNEAIQQANDEIRSRGVNIVSLKGKKEALQRIDHIPEEFLRDHPVADRLLYERIREAGEKYIE